MKFMETCELNKMNTITKKIIAVIIAVTCAVCLMSPSVAQAATVEELLVQIAELQTQLETLRVRLAELERGKIVSSGQTLNVNLRYGDRGGDVALLQAWLAKDSEIYPEGLVTGWFGPLTKAAVIRFQEKYAEDVIAPWGLTKGTGFVGKTTRAKLNAFYIKNKKVIILMYHGLVKDSEVDEEKFKLGYEGAPYLYARKESQFINDMEYIKKEGYEVISLYDFLEMKNKKKSLQDNAVIITFDDGHKSQYDIAFPILKQHGFKATFFVITNRPNQQGYMSWDNLRDIANFKDENGENLFNIESHSHTHSYLSKNEFDSEEELEKRVLFELQTSKNLIEKEIGKIPRFFAVPGCWSWENEDIIKELAKWNGYFGVRWGLRRTVDMSSDVYQLSSYPALNKTETPVPLGEWFGLE